MRCGVIFDLDGTLLDTLDDLHESVNYALGACGYPLRTREEVRKFVGNGIRKLMLRALPEGLSPEACEACFNTFKEHYAGNLQKYTAPYPKIMDLLAELSSQDIVLGVVSNKFQEGVESLVRIFFGDYIQVAVGNRPELKTKPAPDALFLAIKEMGLDANLDQIYYVGDSDVDIQTARNSHLPIISVTWGFRTRAELEAFSPDYLIDSPQDILKIVIKR